MMIQISEKSANFDPKRVFLLRKQLIGKVERFWKSDFDLNQGHEIVLTQNH